jgi:DNA-binding Lrp family transcriptional regulator
LLQEDSRLSQNDIAFQIGISQPSIGIRIKRLKDKGFLSFLKKYKYLHVYLIIF